MIITKCFNFVQINNQVFPSRKIEIKFKNLVSPRITRGLMIFHCTKNEVFHWGFLQQMWLNPQFPRIWSQFTEEIPNGKLHFLCSVFKKETAPLWQIFEAKNDEAYKMYKTLFAKLKNQSKKLYFQSVIHLVRTQNFWKN